MKIINTHTGKIYVDEERQLEFLTVGDYGKENNIKADFLGLHEEDSDRITCGNALISGNINKTLICNVAL